VELVRPLLDALEEQVSPETRDGIAERLVRIGPAAGPPMIERLGSSNADVRLCVLKALLALPERPESFALSASYGDPSPEIRRLALVAGMASGQEGRREALRASLRDPEEGIVRSALEELVRECPSGLDRDLIAAAGDRLRNPAIRQAAIRALGALGLDSTREALIEMVWEHKFMWINGLRSKSLEMLEALSALARHRASEPGVARILKAATRSRDPQVRACVLRRETSE
jgi:HEAT repeat protein